MVRAQVATGLFVLLVVLAGCLGGFGGGDATPTTTAAETTTAPTASGTLAIHYLNVGQGDSTLIVGPEGETVLIDTGDFKDDGEHVIAYLKAQGITRLDALVSTHADADHIGGNAAVIEYFETEGEGVGAVYDSGIVASTATYDRYLDAVEEYDVPLYQTRAGDTIPMAGVEISVLSPPEGYLADDDRNENSIVLKVTHGANSVLLPGDAEREAEAYLVEAYNLDVTVWKASHHGSSTSNSPALLDEATPAVSVISSDYDSRYGHPHQEIIDRFAARDITTFWTATHGNVVMESNGTALTVKTQRAAPTAAADLRNAAPVSPGLDAPVETRLVVRGDEAIAVGETPTTTEVTPDGGVSLVVKQVHADAAGRDGENLNDEYLVFENTGSEPLSLAGWTVRDEAGKTYTFSELTLDPGATVTLHTGSGTDSDTDRYWDASGPVWNNDGDTVTVTDDEGTVVVEVTY
ncbi:lamin tail domain-containing protein [Haladaptatus sp. DJG-WS-42]|uniref:lamin tail domain-containing protein n=1 Tax=Haladaptatus sp. DJG-WS-42 TaxID=3120516 RepID=UPI0030CD29F8